MKKIILLISFLLLVTSCSKDIYSEYTETIEIKLINNLDIERADEFVSISKQKLIELKKDFNFDAFIVLDKKIELASQINEENISFVCDFKPKETKTVLIKYAKEGSKKRNYKNRTYAELAMKTDYELIDNKYTGGRFENVTKITVPEIHTDHDALFKYEGPGWESEKIAYRFYLDWRNATDIFGKKVDSLVLPIVGKYDIVAQNESYQKMQDWGMDIFKVGKSLGIGSVGMMVNDKVQMVNETDKIDFEITQNGPIKSKLKTEYFSWKVGENKFDLKTELSITAGSRLTKCELDISENPENMVTGIVKHSDTELIHSDKNGKWNYLALYGKQTLSKDNLGLVIFYDSENFIKHSEDKINYIVEMKPVNGKLQYYFAAAWEQEQNGIKNKKEFETYLKAEQKKLNNPIEIKL